MGSGGAGRGTTVLPHRWVSERWRATEAKAGEGRTAMRQSERDDDGEDEMVRGPLVMPSTSARWTKVS